jgi:hypothetical protein
MHGWSRAVSAALVLAVLVALPTWTLTRSGPIHWAARTLFAAPGSSKFILVAAGGQPAPLGGQFDHFDVAHQPIVAPVNALGEVAFFSSLLRSPAEEGLFLFSGGGMRRVAAVGDPLPDGGTLGNFAKLPIPSLNSQSAVAFTARISGGSATEGVFVAAKGRIRAVALAGRPVAGVPGGTLLGFEDVSLNDRGEVAFLASVGRGRDQADALLRGDSSGGLTRLAVSGDPAPGGGTFAAFGPPVINGEGGAAFAATVEQGPWLGGVYLLGPKAGRLVAGAGQPSPLGGIFAKFSERVSLNDRGQVVFVAVLKDTRVGSAIFLADGESVVALAEEGAPAPGGGRYAQFGPWAALDDQGRAAFAASVDGGPSSVGIFLVGREVGIRVIGVGDDAGDGRRVSAFPLYPVATAGAGGRMSFAAVLAGDDAGRQALFVTPPQP